MVKPLFDTNILIDLLNAVPEAREELARYEERAASVITWMEVMIGAGPAVEVQTRRFLRSEEHTSELQSHMRISYAVFSLKKKLNYSNTTQHTCQQPMTKTEQHNTTTT